MVVPHHPHVYCGHAGEDCDVAADEPVPGPFGREAAGAEFNAGSDLDHGEESDPYSCCVVHGEEMEGGVVGGKTELLGPGEGAVGDGCEGEDGGFWGPGCS